MDAICQKLEALLSVRESEEERLRVSVEVLCKMFEVEKHEVAIFKLDQAEDCFFFRWPVELRASGTIPASASRSLVAITARERRGSLNNSFASTPHLFVFESFSAAKTGGIQRIMSVPMVVDDRAVGVIQLSRRGEEGDSGVKIFTQLQLNALAKVAQVIAAWI